MDRPGFACGHLKFSAGWVDCGEVQCLLGETWENGYLAFSSGEVRLEAVRGQAIAVAERIVGFPGVEGYLMEAGLWRANGTAFEEIAAEREDTRFWLQRFFLETNVHIEDANCVYKPAATFERERIPSSKAPLFRDDELRTIEVVCPLSRLHIFITTGEMAT
jgi:hypothetical protein